MADAIDKELEEWRRLVKFHESEVVRYKAKIDSKLFINTELNKKMFVPGQGGKLKKEKADLRRKRDLDYLYNVLKADKKYIGTGEICNFLNGNLDSKTEIKYNSSDFNAQIGKALESDERFKVLKSNTYPKMSYGLNEWE